MILTDIIFKNYVQFINFQHYQTIPMWRVSLQNYNSLDWKWVDPERRHIPAFTRPLPPSPAKSHPFLLAQLHPHHLCGASPGRKFSHCPCSEAADPAMKDGRESWTDGLWWIWERVYFSAWILSWFFKKLTVIILTHQLIWWSFDCKHKSRHRLCNPIIFLF